MFLVDTNVVSELRKGNTSKINENVALWADSVNLNELYISVITLQELQTGIFLLKRKDEKQALILQQWFEGYVLQAFRERIVPIDSKIALVCADLHVPDKRPYADSLIAATAIQHSMTLVTRNISDFSGLDITIFNPWK